MPVTPQPRPTLRLSAIGATEPGRVRKQNEDVILLREDLQLFAVADGAGGHQAGDIAARIAAASIANYLEATAVERHGEPDFDRFGISNHARWLSRAIHKANRDVREAAEQLGKERGMGSTVVAIYFAPAAGQLTVAHVGDSRCYRMRSGALEQLTRDHSLLNDVIEERPELDEKVLAKLPRNVVTRALGMAEKTRVGIGTFDVAPGDRYLLCSDGLGAYVPGQLIADCLADPRPTGAIVQLLLNAADEAGGKDNVSVIVVECLTQIAESERRMARLAAERRAAATRAEVASAPELLLVGIEELDLHKAVEALTGPGLPSDDRDLLDALAVEQEEP